MSLPQTAATFMQKFGLRLPVIQAPMAGTSSPQLAASVSNSGALGSLGLGAAGMDDARQMIRDTRAMTDKPFNVNFFCHQRQTITPGQAARWRDKLQPVFAQFGAEPPLTLHEIYGTFYDNDTLLAMVLQEKPQVASFHFGLPTPQAIRAMRQAGIYLMANATSPDEAQAAEKAGMDAIIAQGIEAGGHRGVFDENGPDDRLGLIALLRQLVRQTDLPVIAAGGIMDGAAIRAVLQCGAAAAQMGTAFIGCPESLADDAYRQRLQSPAAQHTVLTRALSGRPARSLQSAFTDFSSTIKQQDVAPYPFAYDAAKQLHKAAIGHDNTGYGAYWAGQGAPLARALPAAELIAQLVKELQQTE